MLEKVGGLVNDRSVIALFGGYEAPNDMSQREHLRTPLFEQSIVFSVMLAIQMHALTQALPFNGEKGRQCLQPVCDAQPPVGCIHV